MKSGTVADTNIYRIPLLAINSVNWMLHYGLGLLWLVPRLAPGLAGIFSCPKRTKIRTIFLPTNKPMHDNKCLFCHARDCEKLQAYLFSIRSCTRGTNML